MEEVHRGGNRLCLVEPLGLACGSITRLSVADTTPRCGCSASLVMSIGRLSILFLVCLEGSNRGGNPLCLAESLGLACAWITLLPVKGIPKMWLWSLPGHVHR